MSKKRKQANERFLILENCDRGTILEVTKILLKIVAETDQYFKERDDVAFFPEHSKWVLERENKVKEMLLGLHDMFKD